MSLIKEVVKRDGRIVPFDKTKIADAIFKAAQAVGGEDRDLAEELADAVTFFLEKKYTGQPPGIEDIQDMVERVLMETGHSRTAKAYILYRDRRAQLRRRTFVRKSVRRAGSSTDLLLLVDPGTKDEVLAWDRDKIVQALVKEADVEPAEARKIASAVEKKIFDSGLDRISSSLIRELVDNELFERGHSGKLAQQTTIGMPKYDLEQLIFSRSKENSNITANNPEAINLAIAENTLKQYALQEVFSRNVSAAHLNGRIHLHDLGYPTRVYCSSHSLEYLKKYGLSLQNLDTASAPAKHARTLTGHLNTFLASMQAYYAGALGVGYINVLYAPYLEGLNEEEMRQEAQHLIFSGSQSAFSRGGQTLFLDFNVHTGVPRYIRNIPAIGPEGKETGRTYGQYERTGQRFTRALLDVWRQGDRDGHVFAFPKCDFHVTEESFRAPDQFELLQYACKIAGENGTPYFVFDRDEVTLSACCRLRTAIKDNYMLEHLESMRFCGFQNVTVNLPQAAYRVGPGNVEGLLKDISEAMAICVQAHVEKRRFVEKLMSGPEMPLWEIGKKALDERPYVDLNEATYIIGLVGLNECVQYICGKELHEGDEPLKLGLKIVSHMYFEAQRRGQEHHMKFSLEESPAESATRRLTKIDLRSFPQSKALMRGSVERDEYYYTNSVHLRASAPVDMITRIRLQSKFHTLIESGAIIHAFVGEHLPSPESILNLVHKTMTKTQTAQLTISPEFTICKGCGKMTVGSREECPHCGAFNILGVRRDSGRERESGEMWRKAAFQRLELRQTAGRDVFQKQSAG
jgi:ribonucleoside-triphosphate reductase